MTAVLGIDPGPVTSGVCLFDGTSVVWHGDVDNNSLAAKIALTTLSAEPFVVAIEKVQSYGRPVGGTVLETVYWTGRFMQAAIHRGVVAVRIPFPDIKKHLCRGTAGKDKDVQEAIARRLGHGSRAAAKGTRRTPGPLAGLSPHVWSALAIALVQRDRSLATRQS